jgi:hypothetical protein
MRRVPSLRTLPLLALSGLLFLVSGSCGATLPLGSVASGSRTTPPSASPTTSVPGGQTVYVSPFDHYSITYPSNWFISLSPQAGGTTSISNESWEKKPNRWKLDIGPEPNPQGLTTRHWADRPAPAGCPVKVLSETTVTVGGKVGLMHNASSCMGGWIGIYVPHAGRMFLMFATDQAEFQPTLASILASIRFT